MSNPKLKVQGAPAAQALFDLFNGNGVSWSELGGGWHQLELKNWAGTEYAALVHARQCFPSDRIFAATATSAR